ncbi:MAG: hypothetical protein K2N70_00305 [Helicobacter sp.]|nr:hypothetical protein [Helicobacter sp.]
MKKLCYIIALFGLCFAENGIFSEIGAGVGYYRYDEPRVMNTDELLLNINAKLGYRHEFVKAEAVGDVFSTFGLYTGGYLEFDEIVDDIEKKTSYGTASSQIFNGQAKVGIDLLAFSDTMDLFVQSGIGYWFMLDRDYLYKRQQVYVYVPIELEGEIRSAPSFAWTYLLGYNHLIDARHKTLSTPTKISNADLFAKQDKGFGLKGSFGWKKQNKDSLNFTRIVVDYWKIGDSKPSDIGTSYLNKPVAFYEPRNFTLSVYLQYGWRF